MCEVDKPQSYCMYVDSLADDEAALLTPSTFSVAAYRAELRSNRSPAELKRILVGEQAVLRARAARALHLQDTVNGPTSGTVLQTPRNPLQGISSRPAARHAWSAAELVKIQRGKEAAQRMKASTCMRKTCRSLRDSCDWARSSLGGEDSAVFLKHDVNAIKQDVLRYEESASCHDSPRSVVSSVDSPQPKDFCQYPSRMQQSSSLEPHH